MKTLIALFLLATASFVNATTITPFNSTLDVGNDAGGKSVGGFLGPFGNVNVTLLAQTATITFTGLNAFQFGGQGAVGVNINAATFIESIINDPDFKQFVFNSNEDGFGSFNLVIDNNSFSTGFNTISFSVTNTSLFPWASAADVLVFNASGFDAAAHVRESIGNPTGLTGYAAEDIGGTQFSVPDGGSTLMLMGGALVALGLARKKLA